MTATSSAGNKPHRATTGFSLLELLVVMVIAAVALGLAVPRLDRSLDVIQYKRSVRAVLTSARQARSEALTRQEEVRLVFDLRARTFSAEDSKPQLIVPAAAELEMTVSELERSDDEAAIRFYPDGSATGGRIELRFGQLESVIDVDWLTGVADLLDDRS